MAARGIIAAVLGVAVALAACSGSAGSASSKPSDLVGQNQVGPYDGAGLVPPQPRPSFTLTATSGKPLRFSSVTAGHPTFLYFGYTNCPDICPETMADISIALHKVPASVASRTYVVFVTTDVKRDTGPVIARWLANFSHGSRATWVGLRGSQTQIDAAQAAAHITLASDGGQTHSAQVLLYGPDDYAHVTFLQSGTEQQAMAHDLPIVARG